MDFSALVTLACEIVGGLGLFLLGMKHLSDGMQAVTGSTLRAQRAGLGELNRHLAEYLADINAALHQENRNVLAKTETLSRRIRDEIKQLRRKHLEDLSSGTMPPQVNIAYLAALNAYARVRDHSRNIAETISGEK